VVRLKAFATAAIGALAAIASAHAADLPVGPPVVPRWVAPLPQPFTWYLRADLGFRANTIHDVGTSVGFLPLTDNKMDGSVMGGFGAGFKWRQLRTDLTVDAAPEATFTGSGLATAATAKVQSFTGLANVYYDFGTWWSVTPYIGVGAGAARLSVSGYRSASNPPFAVSDNQVNNFAWAMMAGANYQILPNLGVDVGYRYLDQGDARTAADAFGHLTLKNLRSHELRLGVRWSYAAPYAFTR
jgi:opacity protein-like surface antigen